MHIFLFALPPRNELIITLIIILILVAYKVYERRSQV